MLKMHGIIRVPPIFAFPDFFILLCDLGWYVGVLEDMKNGQFSQDFLEGFVIDRNIFQKIFYGML